MKVIIAAPAPDSPPSPLLDLPTELIVRILACLPCPALLSCRLASRSFRALIDADTSLQYIIELHAAGAVDNPASRHVLVDRLRILKERERAWHRLEFSRIAHIQVPHNPSSIYDLTGGTFLLGESYSRILPVWRSTDATRSINLRALLKANDTTNVLDGPWAHIDIHSKIMDVGIAAQEHDLIAIVTYSYAPSRHSLLCAVTSGKAAFLDFQNLENRGVYGELFLCLFGLRTS